MLKPLFNSIQRLFRRKRRFRDQQGFDYTISIANGCTDMTEKYSQWHGEALNENILKHKKSDTLFILGSGPSINEITPDEWKHIATCDSVGFNRWMAHDFIPTYYFIQFVNSGALLRLYRKRSPEYKNVPLLIRGDRFANGLVPLSDMKRYEFLKSHELYYVKEYAISSHCAIKPEKPFRHVETLGMMTHGRIGPFVPKWRSTLGLMTSWAYQLGYQKIVFCGMDMQNNDHFWHHESYAERRKRYQLPDVIEENGGKFRSNILTFTDTTLSTNTVPRYSIELAAWMKQRAGVETYVMKKGTILYPDLPLYSADLSR